MEPGKAIVASGASLKSTLHKRERLDSASKKNYLCHRSNQKNFFRQIAFLAVLNFFPLQKLIFEIAKNGIWSKKFREIDLFDLTSFFGLDFFKFSGLLLCNNTELKSEKSTI